PQGVLAVVMNFHSMGKDIAAANLNMVNCSLKGLAPLPKLDQVTSLLKQCGFPKLIFIASYLEVHFTGSLLAILKYDRVTWPMLIKLELQSGSI
ncbi:MAG: hypothetical protein DRH12_06185, partial [Deltaproteobacteria bacterium]